MILSGVYQITNQINGNRYIGSSVDIKQRWAHHKSALNTGRHRNQHLQRAWDKYGKDNFEFEIICSCPKNKTIEFEQFFLDARYPEYNIAKCATASALGLHRSIETKRKISEANKNPSAETRRKISEAKKNPSAETRHRMSEAKKGKIPWNKGKHLSAETRRKLSEAHKGKIPWNKGGHLSAEIRRKLSEAQKDNKSSCWIHFTEDELKKMQVYRNAGNSYNAIGRKFNVSPKTIKRHLNSLERRIK